MGLDGVKAYADKEIERLLQEQKQGMEKRIRALGGRLHRSCVATRC
jgi:hypothetical protein